MQKQVFQSNIFGGMDNVATLKPQPPAKPINGHAQSLYILLVNSNKWIDILYVVKNYVYIKFQTRLGEIIRTYPGLVEKRKKVVATKFGNNTDVTEYRLLDYAKALHIYNEVINVKGNMFKTIHGLNLLKSEEN